MKQEHSRLEAAAARRRAGRSGVLRTVSEAKICVRVAAVSFPAPPPPPTSLFNDISYSKVAPIRNPLLVGALLSHRSLPLSFFVPCSLEVTSGMLSRLFCVSLCKVPSQFCGGGHCPGPRISRLPALGLRREQARQGGREPEAAEEQDLRGCLTSRCWGAGGLGHAPSPGRGAAPASRVRGASDARPWLRDTLALPQGI